MRQKAKHQNFILMSILFLFDVGCLPVSNCEVEGESIAACAQVDLSDDEMTVKDFKTSAVRVVVPEEVRKLIIEDNRGTEIDIIGKPSSLEVSAGGVGQVMTTLNIDGRSLESFDVAGSRPVWVSTSVSSSLADFSMRSAGRLEVSVDPLLNDSVNVEFDALEVCFVYTEIDSIWPPADGAIVLMQSCLNASTRSKTVGIILVGEIDVTETQVQEFFPDASVQIERRAP